MSEGRVWMGRVQYGRGGVTNTIWSPFSRDCCRVFNAPRPYGLQTLRPRLPLPPPSVTLRTAPSDLQNFRFLSESVPPNEATRLGICKTPKEWIPPTVPSNQISVILLKLIPNSAPRVPHPDISAAAASN